MSTRLVNVDRQTPMMFPPDLRDWVRPEDLVHFVVEAVELLPLVKFRLNRRGSGSEQYPPKMMLSLLIYCYSTGTFSSRAIEELTYSHISVRYLCANTHPDHDTINRFRKDNKALLEETFVKVLELARELKLVKMGTVAIDGTKIAANASKHSAVSYGRAGEIVERLKGEVQELLLKAEEADRVPLQVGLSIPEEMARREDRKKKLEEARAAIEARVKEEAKAKQAAYEAKVAERQLKRQRDGSVRGREPQPPSSEPAAKEQYNFTDPESRIMKAGNGQHFEQAYNAQAAVDVESMLVMGQHVSDAPNDKEQLQPTVESIPASLGKPEKVIVDAGFFNGPQIEAVEGPRKEQTEKSDDNDGPQGPGVAVEEPAQEEATEPVTTVYAAVGRIEHDRPLAEYEARSDPAAPPPEAPLVDRMRHRLSTAEGKAVYKVRKHTVEPVFGIIKHVIGFRRFSLRGREKVGLEWTLVCLAWNMKRLHTLGMGAKMAKAA
jgi:transposase